jgi:ubiquitin C-terminal hydrolase
MQDLNASKSQGQTLWTPLKLMPMNIIQQQDAQEYFSRIIEGMEKEISCKLKPAQAPSNFAGLGALLEVDHSSDSSNAHVTAGADLAPPLEEIREKEQHSDQTHSERLPSPSLQNPVDGLLAQRLICSQCHYSEGITLVPFNTLTVPLSNSTWKSYEVFDECLHDYLKSEELEGVECGKCTLLARRSVLENCLKDADPIRSETLRKELARARDALAAEDFSERTLVKDLGLEKKLWRRSTKSKHLAIARNPKALVLHIQRSSFNPFTFRQEKNNSPVKFPTYQDLSCFSLEGRASVFGNESFEDELKMQNDIASPTEDLTVSGEKRTSNLFALRAVIGHSGVHDYGHYVCFRKFQPSSSSTVKGQSQLVVLQCSSCQQLFEESSDLLPDQLQMDIEAERWWRLSDESVWEVSENNVTQQSNAYMLFYELCSPVQSLDIRCPDCIELNQSAALDKNREITAEVAADRREDEPSEKHAVERLSGSFELLDSREMASTATADRDGFLVSRAPNSSSSRNSSATPHPENLYEAPHEAPHKAPHKDPHLEAPHLESPHPEASQSDNPSGAAHSMTKSSIHSASHDTEYGRQLMTPPCTPEPWQVSDGSEPNKTLVEAR